MAGLGEQAEVAVGGLAQLLGGHGGSALHGLGHRPLAGDSPPGLDHVPDEIHATLNRLQDGLRRIESGAKDW
ncbi:hypothetical protein D3C77_684460 [compost metagenome]